LFPWYRAEDERPDFFAHLLNRGDDLLNLAGGAPPGGGLLLELNQAGVNRFELVDALRDDDYLLLCVAALSVRGHGRVIYRCGLICEFGRLAVDGIAEPGAKLADLGLLVGG
jgi:hypothetical protein